MIAIVGLTPQQETQMKREFSESLSLTFVSSSPENKNRTAKLATTAEKADTVILMTKFVAHTTQNTVRKHPGLVFLNGGLSSLREKLKEYCALT